MKVCSKCRQGKDLLHFAWRSKKDNRLHGQCNDCRRQTARDSYNRNKDLVVEAVRIRNKSYKDAAINWKSKLYCVFCKESYIKCIDFHHLDPTEKDYDISGMTAKYPLSTILKEVSKCIVVCSNCHRKIHGDVLCITPDIIEKSKLMIKTISLD